MECPQVFGCSWCHCIFSGHFYLIKHIQKVHNHVYLHLLRNGQTLPPNHTVGDGQPTSSSSEKSIVPRGWTAVHTLGEGAFGEVVLLLKNGNNAQNLQGAMAMKILDTSQAVKVARSEFRLHRSLEHPNVVRFLGHQRHGPMDCLFLEYCSGGDLFDRLGNEGLGDEGLARRYFGQLVTAVDYLHSVAGVFHADIKPKNILLDAEDNIKLADFGMAAALRGKGGDERLFTKWRGTFGFRAPEVLEGGRGRKRRKFKGRPVDVWACGVVLVLMLTGTEPWEQAHADCPEYQDWLAGKTHLQPWSWIGPAPLSLLSRLLEHSPEERITIADVKEHHWLS